MTIKQIKENTIEQHCDNCGAIQELEIDALTMGVVIEEHTVPNLIRLPTCDQCRITEYLFVSEDTMQELSLEPDGEDRAEVAKSLHQLLVDQLGKRILERHQ